MKPIQAARVTAGQHRARTTARSRDGALGMVLGVVLLLVTACGGGGPEDGGKDGPGGGDKSASQAVVNIAPKDGADGVATTGALKVTASKGRLSSVEVADDKGGKVRGGISKDGRRWEPAEHLGTGTKYTVDAIAKDSDGRQSAKHSTFTTLAPKDTFIGYYTPEDGSTVGSGMSVSLNFNRPIADTGAVEKAVKVTAEPAVEIAGHWFGNQRLDFRPEEYWAAGTKVTLSLRLRGVEGADRKSVV